MTAATSVPDDKDSHRGFVRPALAGMALVVSLLLPGGPLLVSAALALTWWKGHRAAQTILVGVGLALVLAQAGIHDWPGAHTGPVGEAPQVVTG